MKHILKALAPYLAVVVFWCVLENAWLAILAYHAQILMWSRRSPRELAEGGNRRALIVIALPAVLLGPLLYFLLPSIANVPVAEWMTRYHVTGRSLLLMIPYFGVIHPLLEQLHWSDLRERTPAAHLLFAGYHMIVLFTLLPPLWLAMSFLILMMASIGWRRVTRTHGGPAVACASHVLADLGVIIAAWAMMK